MRMKDGRSKSCLQVLLRYVMSPFNSAPMTELIFLFESRQKNCFFGVNEAVDAGKSQND